MKKAEELNIIENTKSVCPRCNKIINAVIFEKDGKVMISKKCPKHGKVQDVYWSDDINNDGIVDIILLKKNSLLEIDLLKKDTNALSINKTMDVSLPCPASEIISVDINTDGKKEFLVLEPSGKKIYIISIKSL